MYDAEQIGHAFLLIIGIFLAEWIVKRFAQQNVLVWLVAMIVLVLGSLIVIIVLKKLTVLYFPFQFFFIRMVVLDRWCPSVTKKEPRITRYNWGWTEHYNQGFDVIPAWVISIIVPFVGSLLIGLVFVISFSASGVFMILLHLAEIVLAIGLFKFKKTYGD